MSNFVQLFQGNYKVGVSTRSAYTSGENYAILSSHDASPLQLLGVQAAMIYVSFSDKTRREKCEETGPFRAQIDFVIIVFSTERILSYKLT